MIRLISATGRLQSTIAFLIGLALGAAALAISAPHQNPFDQFDAVAQEETPKFDPSKPFELVNDGTITECMLTQMKGQPNAMFAFAYRKCAAVIRTVDKDPWVNPATSSASPH